ncbi:MAG: hypothetical protein PXX77_06765 [Gallionella sp.]|nr:hypothetical protein [Gallionella sp.]
MLSMSRLSLTLGVVFCFSLFTAHANAASTWRVMGAGTQIEVTYLNPGSVSLASSKLIFGANLPANQQMMGDVTSINASSGYTSMTITAYIPKGAPSGTLIFAPVPSDPSQNIALTGKLLNISDPASCTNAGFTASTVGTHLYCVFPNNFTQGTSDYLLVGSTVTTQSYYPITTSNYLKSTGNQVTLHNVVLKRDPIDLHFGAINVNYTQSTNGVKDTLNLTQGTIGGWLVVQGDLNVSGLLKTVGYGSILIQGGTANLNAPNGQLWMATTETQQLFAILLQNNGALYNNGGIYQDLKSTGVGVQSGTLMNNAMFHIQSPWGLIVGGSGGSVINQTSGILNVGSSLKRAVDGIYNYPGGTIVNIGTVNNNQTNGIYNDGMITNCSSRGKWNGSNASPTEQVNTIVVACGFN